ncbi:hypothetical protein DN752_23525 [Echinicola strongylocentroti]|uniref:DUF5018 domain-containing protein n=1 Tax=Echinicola strongylocentroti TaxID=1795355 RepID=A0A2Z4IQ25_9BACT|nr:hypothetical protein DN752_23525 [Echinicola strongylocentroti]
MLLSACLQSGLEELPAFEEADITNFRFEYRWINEEGNYPQLNVQGLETLTEVDATSGTVTCVVKVPNASQDFPESIRSQVALSELVGFADISNASTIQPTDGAPVLGQLADFSQGPYEYEITAANGNKKVWILEIAGFEK